MLFSTDSILSETWLELCLSLDILQGSIDCVPMADMDRQLTHRAHVHRNVFQTLYLDDSNQHANQNMQYGFDLQSLIIFSAAPLILDVALQHDHCSRFKINLIVPPVLSCPVFLFSFIK